MLIPILQALAGIIVLALALSMDQPVSLGTALGLLLLVSAFVRYLIARDAQDTSRT